MDFENFCNSEELKAQAEELKNNSGADIDGLINKYKNKSKSELYEELLRVAKQEKAKGKLDKQQLHNIFNTLKPMIDKNEQENLKKLIDMIGE